MKNILHTYIATKRVFAWHSMKNTSMIVRRDRKKIRTQTSFLFIGDALSFSPMFCFERLHFGKMRIFLPIKSENNAVKNCSFF